MFGTAQARERAQVFGELASMVHAGVSIGESLTAVAEGMPHSRMQHALRMVGHDVSGGKSLGESVKRYADVFSPLTLAMVEVGERGGRIEESLRNIADYFEREFRLRSLLRRELTYPIILLIAILFIPLAGRMIVVWLNDSVTAAIITGIRQLFVYLLVFGLPALGAWLVARSLRQSHEGRLRIDRIKLSIPLIGTVVRKLALARFCRALASLYSAGVMMSTSLRLAGEASGNEVLNTELGGGARTIERGGSLSDALGGSSLIPGTVLRMLKTGETTGEIDAMANNVANHLEQEAETSIKQMAVTITPVAVLIAGVVVAIMVIGFYADLYSF